MRTAFCMGIWMDAEFREWTCPKRDNCMYYVEGFYARHISHIDDFEQLHNIPGKACSYYMPRYPEREKKETDPFGHEGT